MRGRAPAAVEISYILCDQRLAAAIDVFAGNTQPVLSSNSKSVESPHAPFQFHSGLDRTPKSQPPDLN